MAYDYATTTPGPGSPLWWVKEVVAFALTQVAATQLVVGQPFYGREWPPAGGGQQPALTQAEALALLATSGATLQRTPTDAIPWFTWTTAGVQHHVFYEDATSLSAKLAAIMSAGVAGCASGASARKRRRNGMRLAPPCDSRSTSGGA